MVKIHKTLLEHLSGKTSNCCLSKLVNSTHIVETFLRVTVSAHALCGHIPNFHLMLQHHAHVATGKIHRPKGNSHGYIATDSSLAAFH